MNELRAQVLAWADPNLYLLMCLGLFLVFLVLPFRSDPRTGRSPGLDDLGVFDRLIFVNAVAWPLLLLPVTYTYTMLHPDGDVAGYMRIRLSFWWPLLAASCASGFGTRYALLKHFLPWWSAKRKSWRNVQPTERPSDIRQEIGHYKPQPFNPQDYDKPGHMFFGLDAETRKPVYTTLTTFQKTHTQLIGKTGYGKTSAAMTILRQCVLNDFFTFCYDPEQDDNLRDGLYSWAKETGRMFSYVDFNGWADDGWRPSWGPLIGGSEIGRHNRATILCGVEDSGGGSGAEFHHVNAQSVLLEAIQKGCSSVGSFVDYAVNRIPDNDPRKGSVGKITSVLGLYQQMPQFSTKRGFSLQTAIIENHVVYIRSSTEIQSYIKAGKCMLLELMETLRNMKRFGVVVDGERVKRSTHAAVYFDGAKYVISRELAAFTENARKEDVSIMLAHQAAFDMKSLPDPRIRGDALHNSIMTNASIKIIHAQEDREGCEWAAEQSGFKNMLITRSERTMVNQAGGEEHDQGRTLGSTNAALVDPNKFHTAVMPPNIGLFKAPGQLPVVINTCWITPDRHWQHKNDNQQAPRESAA